MGCVSVLASCTRPTAGFLKGQTLIHKMILSAGMAAFVSAIPSAGVAKAAPVYTGTFSSVAMSGYDPVAYFTQHAAVKGLSQFATTYNGAKWHFATAADLAAFKKEPAKYAPQYGGYCAWAVSQGYTASGDPEVWQIVNGMLYVNYNKEVGEKWSRNIPGFIAAANANWPKVLGK